MMDFGAARRLMVEGQVRAYDVTDLRVLEAMLAVPRERFVPTQLEGLAYLDRDIDVRGSSSGSRRRFMLKPAVLARLIQAAELEPANHVLDVGCGTGYSAAVLARLAATVVALEEDGALATTAAEVLAALGVSNATIVTGTLTQGAPAHAPFDVVLLNGSTEVTPGSLIRQLGDGGRLVCVLGSSPIGKATVFRLTSGHVTQQQLFDAAAPVLPGFARPVEFAF
jgi:protein-L-isoaspartate(D-aspartate) O-methyltransferase